VPSIVDATPFPLSSRTCGLKRTIWRKVVRARGPL
jgi:hypothetical protein